MPAKSKKKPKQRKSQKQSGGVNIRARQLRVEGQVVGRDLIINEIIDGLDKLITPYDGLVKNFLEFYLGKERPAPFGGRADDLATLNTWLNNPNAPQYALLTAPAGRGKSALLAHWVAQLGSKRVPGSKTVHVVYFPISMRYSTNLESVAFASLAARMAHIYGEKVTQAVDVNLYRSVFTDYLRRTPPNRNRVLVVVDGLDEAMGWKAGADLFPTLPPSHLRVIVAARPLAGDADETAWLNRLGWKIPNRAQTLTLAGLNREGVRDVLIQMKNPLDQLATKINVIDRLYELSKGDPLLIGLYVEALRSEGDKAATFTSEDLATLNPGLDDYFKLWFDHQRSAWGTEKDLRDKTVHGLLSLCANALGPLTKDDALTLGSHIFENSGLLDAAAIDVNRFIIGDGTTKERGFVFSHPRLGEYFWNTLPDKERRGWQDRFLRYGTDTLARLENQNLHPEKASAYMVKYYGAHLENAKSPATAFYALVCESWLRAWEWLEGTPAGFLNDADRAWQKAEAEGPAALGQQIRAALCFASVTSLSANISKDLLVACVKAGVISPALGLVTARQKPDPMDRAECLAAIAEFHPSESHAIMSEALSAARAISNERFRAEVLGELAPSLPEYEQEEVLGKALAAARVISDEKSRAEVLGKLAPRLSKREQADVLDEALSVARAISDESSRAKVLGELVSRLPEREQAEVLGEALAAARVISDEESRAEVLEKLAPRLPERERVKVLNEAIAAARAIYSERSRAKVLGKLTSHVPKHKQVKVLNEALAAAHVIDSKWLRAEALLELAPQLPESEQMQVVSEAIVTVCTIPNKQIRAYLLCKFAPLLPKSEQVQVLNEALAAVRTIADEESRAKVLCELAPRLPEGEQMQVLGKALAVVRTIDEEQSRTDFLGQLAPQLSESLLDEALVVARAIVGESLRANVLCELATRLPETEKVKVLNEALATARAIDDESSRAHTLCDLAPLLPESLLGEALAAARAIADECSHAYTLGKLVPLLPETEQMQVLGEALAAARAIDGEWSRAYTLGELAPRLPKGEQVQVLSEVLATVHAFAQDESSLEFWAGLTSLLPENLLGKALAAVCTIYDDWSRADFLCELASRLPESLLSEALAAACAIEEECPRAYALGELASRLPENEQVQVLREVLAAARAISDEIERCVALKHYLAPLLPESLLGEALAAARALTDESLRVQLLSELVPRLPEREQVKVLGEALSACALAGEWACANLLHNEVAPLLPASLFGEALAVAHTIFDEGARALALCGLAPWLPESLLVEALVAARTIVYEGHRAEVLGALEPRLPESLLGEALQTARTVCHHDEVFAVLSNLATRWSAVCRSTQRSEFEELSATLRAFARTERPQLLQAIQALLPVIAEQGGEPALAETARAIVDTAKWWP